MNTKNLSQTQRTELIEQARRQFKQNHYGRDPRYYGFAYVNITQGGVGFFRSMDQYEGFMEMQNFLQHMFFIPICMGLIALCALLSWAQFNFNNASGSIAPLAVFFLCSIMLIWLGIKYFNFKKTRKEMNKNIMVYNIRYQDQNSKNTIVLDDNATTIKKEPHLE